MKKLKFCHTNLLYSVFYRQNSSIFTTKRHSYGIRKKKKAIGKAVALLWMSMFSEKERMQLTVLENTLDDSTEILDHLNLSSCI